MASSPLQRVGFALADPVRQSVLVALLDGAAFPADLALVVETSRTNLSNHLACLRGCGLVTATPYGRRLSYELASPSLAHALRDLLTLEAEVCCAVSDSPQATTMPKKGTPKTSASKTRSSKAGALKTATRATVATKMVATKMVATKTVARKTVATNADAPKIVVNTPVVNTALRATRVSLRKARL
jgi:ArsR family transcriptional regulator, cadmium/lead-responsive transcriptional repressor